jgi:hypothetical protein
MPGMKRLLLTVPFIILSCAQALQEHPQPKAAPLASGITINDASRPKLALDGLQPAEVVQAVDATFRLTPDRRFLAAIADVYELSTGRTAASVDIDFREGAWRVRCAGLDVGALPDLPTFADQITLLTQWSTTLAANAATATQPLPGDVAAAVDGDIKAFDPPHLFSAVDRLSKQGPLDADGWTRAAHAATLLTAQIFDQFDFGDPLRARAVALFAMARRGNPQCCADDAVILAWVLGYTSEAEQLGKSLPSSSFAIAFMHGSLSDSNWLTASERLRFVSLSEPPNIFRWPLNIQFAPLLMEVMSFPEQVPIARVEEALILSELETNRFNEGELVFDGKSDWLEANASRLTNIQRGAVIKRFEEALPSRVNSLKTRLLDAAAVRAYYESTFYAAVYKEFAFHFYKRGDREGARSFVAWVGKPAEGTGSQVIAWMSDLIVAEYEAAKGLGRPADVLQRLPRISGRREYDLFYALAGPIGANEPAIRTAAQELYKRLDSRSSLMSLAGWISKTFINDPMRRDRYIQTALQRSPNIGEFGDTASYRFMIGDRAGLRALVDDRSVSAINRASALNSLVLMGDTDSAFIHRRFEELIDETPEISVLTEYASYLNDRGEESRKEQVMRRALRKRADSADRIGNAWIAAEVAGALEEQGHYKEGLEFVAPHLEIGSGIVMGRAASLLQRLGRIQEANELGKAEVARYPGANARAAFARILWRERHYDGAAALFNPTRENYGLSEAIGSLPEAFVETFGDGNIGDAVEAYSALMAAGLDDGLLEWVPQKALDEKKPDLAFALAERFAEKPSNSRAMMGVLIGYRALKQTKGVDAALAWLQTKIPPTAFAKALLDFYAQGEYDLVARYASTVPPEKRGVGLTLQAASLVALRIPHSDPRWQSLLTGSDPLPDIPNSPPFGKFLAGLVDEATLFRAAKTPFTHTDAEYFAGVKAIANNEYDRGLSFMIAASFGSANYAPTIWAQWQLGRWSQEHASWETIVKEHR